MLVRLFSSGFHLSFYLICVSCQLRMSSIKRLLVDFILIHVYVFHCSFVGTFCLALIWQCTNLYMGQTIRVKIEDEFSEPVSLGRRVRQGCPLSPVLFNLSIDHRRTNPRSTTWHRKEIKVGGKLIKARPGDKSRGGFATNDDRLNMANKEYGMKINPKKTMVMKISRAEEY